MILSSADMYISPRLSDIIPSASIAFSSLEMFSRLSLNSSLSLSILICTVFSPAGLRQRFSMNLAILCRMSLGWVRHGKRVSRWDFVQMMFSMFSLNISYFSLFYIFVFIIYIILFGEFQ